MCSTLLLKRLTVVMTEPTSQCFVARIGAAAPDLESRLIQWASSSCQAHCVVRDGDDRVSLYLHRKEAKTVRARQSLIRTLTGRWGLHMGDLGKGWLELCTEEDYKADHPHIKRELGRWSLKDAEHWRCECSKYCRTVLGDEGCCRSRLRCPRDIGTQLGGAGGDTRERPR